MTNDLTQLTNLVRHYILTSTTAAGSGHPTSSLSAADLMTTLFFKYFRFDLDNPDNPNNDRLIFSKGHASPLLYALYTAAGKISPEEILTLRKFDSPLEGHPTPHFKYSEAATGSLGQGLSIGVGMALNAKYLDQLDSKTYVLLGDGEMAEGSVWEAALLASHYHLDNLIAIVDVNRLGQSQETMLEHNVESYTQKLEAFGFSVITLDGHDPDAIDQAYDKLLSQTGKPKAIVAKTIKGKGVSFIEDQQPWHGKALSEDKLKEALAEIGEVDTQLIGKLAKPEDKTALALATTTPEPITYEKGQKVATRNVFGDSLARLAASHPDLISLDGDTKNSTFAITLKDKHPEHFFEMFIAEQNMVGVAVGLAKRGKKVFASTFAAFLTRAYDQLRMAAVSQANIKCVGSHAGVAIGQDGASQMGLEDLAMFRAIYGSTVLYPSDAISANYLIEEVLDRDGIVYIRTNRPATPVLYDADEKFPIGGSKTLKSSDNDAVTLVACGVTLNESLKAAEELAKENIHVRVIDLYSIKPIDQVTLQKAAAETKAIVTVEDHWFEGGLGDAVLSALADQPKVPVIKLAVTQMPRSGTPEELIDWAGLSAAKIAAKVKELI